MFHQLQGAVHQFQGVGQAVEVLGDMVQPGDVIDAGLVMGISVMYQLAVEHT